MSTKPPGADELLALIWPRWGDIAPERMPELLDEIHRVISAVRSEAARNAFDDQPSDFGAALHRLAATPEDTHG